MRRKIAIAWSALAALLVSGSIAAAPSYSATALGTLGGNGSYANAINASGQVTGYSYLERATPTKPNPSTEWHAFLYGAGVMRDLGTLGGPFSAGTAINDSGQVAGFSAALVAGKLERRPVLFDNGALHDLGTLGGADGDAWGINARGEVVGASSVAGSVMQHAFLYANGRMTDLGTLGAEGATARAINASGQITGTADVTPRGNCGSPLPHAFRYSNGHMSDLGTLAGGCNSDGFAINDAGQIAGQTSANGYQEQHAFDWSNGVMHDIGTLGGDTFPFAIDSKGRVVGASVAPDGQNHAFLYADGKMYDLNGLVSGLAGTLLSVANGINDNGQIVANGCSRTLVCQAFLLDPAPPPAAPAKALAVEYYHAAFDHYFITAIPEEIAALDGGRFPGWARTGETFDVYANALPDTARVCRFFGTAFGPESSHFYSADAGECTIVRQSGDWQLEGDVMAVPVPDAAGDCPTGSQPIYRLYNNGKGGAPAHRYTTSLAVRARMLSQGWIPEGYGDNGVSMCSPAS
jgi:probable HAF family extracellular repeat protein